MILMVTANWQNYYIKHVKIAWDNAKPLGRAHTITTHPLPKHTYWRVHHTLSSRRTGVGWVMALPVTRTTRTEASTLALAAAKCRCFINNN